MPRRITETARHNNTISVLKDANLVRHLQQTVFQIDLLGTLKYISPGWRKLTGHDPDPCLQNNLMEYIHPMDREQCRAYFERIILRARETTLHITVRLICNDGRSYWVAMRANPVFDRGSSPRVRGLVGTLSDVTPEIQNADLRDARYRSLQNLVNNLPGMVYRYRNDRNRTMEYISEGCRDLLGYEPRDLINNRKLSYSNLIHEEDRQRVWHQAQAAIQQNRPFAVSYRLHTADGALRRVREWGHGLVSDSGVLLNIEGFIARQHEAAWQQQEQPELYDPHSRLPRPALLLDRLQRLIDRRAGNGGTFLLLLLSLDRASTPRYAELGQRIARSLPRGSTVSLLEDRRCAILLESADHDPDTLARQLRALVHPEPISIGITSDHGHEDAGQALLDARGALEQATARGGNCHEVCGLHTERQHALEQEVEQGELLVHWNLIVSLASGRIRMMEAGIRHPRRGRNYDPLAQASPRAVAATWRWTLREILRQVESWRQIMPARRIPRILLPCRDLSEARCILDAAAPLSERAHVGVMLEDTALTDAEARTRRDLIRQLQDARIHLWLETSGADVTTLPACIDALEGLCLPDTRYDESRLTQGLIGMAKALRLTLLAREQEAPRPPAILRRAGARWLLSARLPTLQAAEVPHTVEERRNWLQPPTDAAVAQ